MAIFFDPRTGQFVQVTPGGQQTNLKMQTTVNTSQNPGQSGMTSGSGAPPPTGTPAPLSGAGGAAGTGGGGTVNTQGGNISQGAIYGGSVTNTASGGTGSLDASGGSNNVYRETTSAPASTPASGPTDPSGDPGGGGGVGGPCQLQIDCGDASQVACVNGTCVKNTCPPGETLTPQGDCFKPPTDGEDRSLQQMSGNAPTFTDFLKRKGSM